MTTQPARLRLGMITPSSNTSLEPMTSLLHLAVPRHL